MKNIISYIKSKFKKSKSINIQELLDNPTDKWGEECKFNGYSIYYRTHGKLENLSEEDYKVGFGLNHTHYQRVSKAREKKGLSLRKDFHERYEHKSRDGGYLIDNTKIVSKHHPLHDKMLVSNETGIKYHIDTVSVGYHYGMVVMLCIRAEGSKSHGCRDWGMVKGGDIETLNRIEENHKSYRLEDIVS